MTHTPGPWSFYQAEGDNEPTEIIVVSNADLPDRNQIDIGSVFFEGGHKETWANARLIAAAPDQNAALKGLVAWFDRVYGSSLFVEPEEFKAARAAIAKATKE